ncbi:hypothetical protein VNO78_31626 [Psophocarpus tetragonolobus]|uniref:Uncharacterized protein n=1 Tax=Psophocarpus tetragonolobus TaxID=3891 RepID=A0AAN9RYP9_PSOTE
MKLRIRTFELNFMQHYERQLTRSMHRLVIVETSSIPLPLPFFSLILFVSEVQYTVSFLSLSISSSL